MATEKEILLCFQNGDSQRRIASYLKVSRNTYSGLFQPTWSRSWRLQMYPDYPD